MAYQPPDACRDIPTCEVLVHITAPSSARDDARFASIAASVLNFQPAKRTKVSDFSFIPYCPLATNTEINATIQTPSPKQRQFPNSEADADREPRNGLATILNTEHTDLQTAVHSQRCAKPEARFFANVSRSLRSISSGAWPHNRSTASRRNPTGRLVTACSEECGINGKRRCSKRRRLGPVEHEYTIARRSQQPRQSDPCICTQQQGSTTVDLVKDSSGPSTVSPSQLLCWQTRIGKDRDAEPGYELGTSFSRPIYLDIGRQHEALPQQEAVRHRRDAGSSKSHKLDAACQSQWRQSSTSQLSNEIHGPNPQGGRARFVTHTTKTLQKLAIRVPLSKHFRPYRVTRDVNVLERGHWQFSVGIIESSVIQDPRQALQKCGSDELISLWSEREFFQLWRNICCFIHDGKAGWGTSIVKKQIRQGVWRIRLFTWAEILGHIWLVLWILSDKIIERVPMHWIDGRGTAVVTMSGKKPQEIGPGRWAQKGAEGEQCYWGIQ